MDLKKNVGRFTVNFNSKNREHIEAARILNSKGRSKADYLARAIQAYEEQEEQRSFLDKIEDVVIENIRKSLFGASSGTFDASLPDYPISAKTPAAKPERIPKQRAEAKPQKKPLTAREEVPNLEGVTAWEDSQAEALQEEVPPKKMEPEPFAKEDHLSSDKKPQVLEYSAEVLKALNIFGDS